jgi:hypothetical protein
LHFISPGIDEEGLGGEMPYTSAEEHVF